LAYIFTNALCMHEMHICMLATIFIDLNMGTCYLILREWDTTSVHINIVIKYFFHKNQAYYKALQYAVDITQTQNKEPIVLDIGTGTGLLAMMAAKCGAKKIYACEVCASILKCVNVLCTYAPGIKANG